MINKEINKEAKKSEKKNSPEQKKQKIPETSTPSNLSHVAIWVDVSRTFPWVFPEFCSGTSHSLVEFSDPGFHMSVVKLKAYLPHLWTRYLLETGIGGVKSPKIKGGG